MGLSEICGMAWRLMNCPSFHKERPKWKGQGGRGGCLVLFHELAVGGGLRGDGPLFLGSVAGGLDGGGFVLGESGDGGQQCETGGENSSE